MLKTIFAVVFVIIYIALTVTVLLQENKSAGLGVVSGVTGTCRGKNKGRSVEGNLRKFTKFAAFTVLALTLLLDVIW